MRLVRQVGEQRVSGIIIETEAYRGEEDLACHARHGKTPRTEVMYGEAGRAYIYFTYGMHWLLNVVTGELDFRLQCLLRAIIPLEGIAVDRSTTVPEDLEKEWCNGPAKICQALQISGAMNGIDLTTKQCGLVDRGRPASAGFACSITGTRIGIGVGSGTLEEYSLAI